MRNKFILLGILAAGALAYFFVQQNQPTHVPAAGIFGTSNAIVTVLVPETLSPNATIGKTAYQSKCAACHGENAAGQDGVAPPLVHVIYEPSHHADEAFQRAAAFGVRGHHWPFADMPAVEGLTRADVAMIVAYVRELQRFNGIK